jgi:hypothetical protein
MKEKYLQLVRDTGFEEVKIAQEKHFPVEYMADDPNVQTIIKKSKISNAKLKGIANSVASVMVCGVKPK